MIIIQFSLHFSIVYFKNVVYLKIVVVIQFRLDICYYEYYYDFKEDYTMVFFLDFV